MAKSNYLNRIRSLKHLLLNTLDYRDAVFDGDKLSRHRSTEGCIYSFDCLFDISWKVMKDCIIEAFEQTDVPNSPKPIITTSGELGIIDNVNIWLEMLKDRNLSTHDYFGINQNKYVIKIFDVYICEFDKLLVNINSINKKYGIE